MSLNITLPDGSVRSYPMGVTGLDVAKSIGDKLYKDVVAIKIDGVLKDLTLPLTCDAAIHLITRQHDDSLDILRHDAAHALAQAVKELYPTVQVTIGPAITNGFYYDFHRDEPFTLGDLEQLEQRMHEIVNRDTPIIREEWDRDEAIAFFKQIGENYKAEIISDIPPEQPITLYRQGDFIDLCRGPHLPSTGRLGKAFKLMKVAGAYWRGDSNNVMLQRIYGTAWATEQQLKDYLFQLEEAEKRDHRKLGKQLGLFHLQEEAAGSVFWHPKGWAIYQTLRHYMTLRLRQHDYVEVNTPILVDRSFWEKSGHWDKYREHMFTSEDDDAKHTLAMKPMNCPCHVQIFKQGIKSYRDLPLRMAEFGSCHRNEHSGALHGLMRVRAFVQDDAHIFCTIDQISSETLSFCNLLKQVYQDLGFTDYKVRFSDRPDMRVGSDETWDKAENALRQATAAAGIDTVYNPGDGAFYGPKLDFVLKDALGREWQLGTLQVDLNLPERLDATYIDEAGQKCRPVMLHRAVLGSFERFIAILIENYAGNFPLWLAPIQVGIVPITDAHHDYARKIANQLKQQGIRVDVDLRNEKMNYKIREYSHNKVPVIFVVGQSECDNEHVTLRYHGQQDQLSLPLDQAIDKIIAESQNPATTDNLRR